MERRLATEVAEGTEVVIRRYLPRDEAQGAGEGVWRLAFSVWYSALGTFSGPGGGGSAGEFAGCGESLQEGLVDGGAVCPDFTRGHGVSGLTRRLHACA